MSKRVCSEPGCPTLIDQAGRCPTHARAKDKARGSRQQRGYGANFDRQKREPAYVEATYCVTCGEAFTPSNPKTAGHRVAIRKGGKGGKIKPECRRCNYGWRRTDS